MNNNKKIQKTKTIGDCPYCDGQILQRSVVAYGKKVKLYTCSNMKVEYDDGDEKFLETQDSLCSFKIFSNCLVRYNKKSLSEYEVRQLISDERQVVVRLYSKKLFNEDKQSYGSEYYRYAIPDLDYGLSVLFDEEVLEEDLPKVN